MLVNVCRTVSFASASPARLLEAIHGQPTLLSLSLRMKTHITYTALNPQLFFVFVVLGRLPARGSEAVLTAQLFKSAAQYIDHSIAHYIDSLCWSVQQHVQASHMHKI